MMWLLDERDILEVVGQMGSEYLQQYVFVLVCVFLGVGNINE